MTQPSPLVDRRLAQQLSVAQFVVIPVVAVVSWWLFDWVVAMSAALGALIGWLGSAYFARQAFKRFGASASQQVLAGFYRGALGKFVIVVVGFGLVFAMVRPLSAGAVLIGFVLVQLMAWVFPLWFNRQTA